MVRLELAMTLTALGPFALALRRSFTDLRTTSAFGPTMIGAPESLNVQFLMEILEIVTVASLHSQRNLSFEQEGKRRPYGKNRFSVADEGCSIFRSSRGD